MKAKHLFWRNFLTKSKQWLAASLLALLLASLFGNPLAYASAAKPLLIAALAKGDAITDPRAILRNALPIDNDQIRQLQASIEDLSYDLRKKLWSAVSKDVTQASKILNTRSDKILDSVPEERRPQAEAILENVKTEVQQLQTAVGGKDKAQISLLRQKLLDQLTDLEELMVVGFPFEVPEAYTNLPQLKGRATVDIETTQGNLTVVVDGYSAPVNGGNFIDLVQHGFYDGLPFFQIEDNFVIQTGDPVGTEEGFIDPKTKQYRAIPLEVFIKREEKPIYGMTLEDAGIYLPDLALPFNAYGAVALARPSEDANGGSSQFFFFKFDNELTPPGFNLMDGRYSVFGYLVEGKDVLGKLSDKDKIISAKVVNGLENLVEP